jgi:hypothetical protein
MASYERFVQEQRRGLGVVSGRALLLLLEKNTKTQQPFLGTKKTKSTRAPHKTSQAPNQQVDNDQHTTLFALSSKQKQPPRSPLSRPRKKRRHLPSRSPARNQQPQLSTASLFREKRQKMSTTSKRHQRFNTVAKTVHASFAKAADGSAALAACVAPLAAARHECFKRGYEQQQGEQQ